MDLKIKDFVELFFDRDPLGDEAMLVDICEEFYIFCPLRTSGLLYIPKDDDVRILKRKKPSFFSFDFKAYKKQKRVKDNSNQDEFVVDKQLSPKEICVDIYKSHEGKSRQRILDIIIETLGVSKGTASSYYAYAKRLVNEQQVLDQNSV